MIISCDGESIGNPGDLRLKVAGNAPGSELKFKVRRGDKLYKMQPAAEGQFR